MRVWGELLGLFYLVVIFIMFLSHPIEFIILIAVVWWVVSTVRKKIKGNDLTKEDESEAARNRYIDSFKR